MNTRTTPIRFAHEPDLWPEEWTDCFRVDLNHDADEYREAIAVVLEETGHDPTQRKGAEYDHLPVMRIFVTDSQLLAERLREELYGREIAYACTHIPAELHG
jgi:hypothetical protein